jgi:Domain of unknown function (DUF4132)
LEVRQIRQPFKQAHREVYVLTDAERTTATYSNRFAAHILRQHQFKSLAQMRGWKYDFQGLIDNGNTPTLDVLSWGVAVEFAVEPVNDEQMMTKEGISLLISTDQVRFRRLGQELDGYRRYGEAVPLAEVPPLLFTELMREVDLFVGVASIGADPTWNDRGPQAIQTYWQHYAFGELNLPASARRALLERLLPKLAIAPHCEISGRSLVVRGKLRTYKIHLGSGNILIAPHNEYLCIVPRRNLASGPESLFLPFEGDALLSTILSKAVLLVDDDKIKDRSIVSQIMRSSA